MPRLDAEVEGLLVGEPELLRELVDADLSLPTCFAQAFLRDVAYGAGTPRARVLSLAQPVPRARSRSWSGPWSAAIGRAPLGRSVPTGRSERSGERAPLPGAGPGTSRSLAHSHAPRPAVYGRRQRSVGRPDHPHQLVRRRRSPAADAGADRALRRRPPFASAAAVRLSAAASLGRRRRRRRGSVSTCIAGSSAIGSSTSTSSGSSVDRRPRLGLGVDSSAAAASTSSAPRLAVAVGLGVAAGLPLLGRHGLAAVGRLPHLLAGLGVDDPLALRPTPRSRRPPPRRAGSRS